MLSLDQALEARINLLPEHKQDGYFRAYITPLYFVSLFETGEAKEQARAAFLELVHSAVAQNKDYILLAAAAYRGEYELPEFIQENLELWLKAMSYLAYGNPEVEHKMSPHLYKLAKAHAHLKIKDEMGALFQLDY